MHCLKIIIIIIEYDQFCRKYRRSAANSIFWFTFVRILRTSRFTLAILWILEPNLYSKPYWIRFFVSQVVLFHVRPYPFPFNPFRMLDWHAFHNKNNSAYLYIVENKCKWQALHISLSYLHIIETGYFFIAIHRKLVKFIHKIPRIGNTFHAKVNVSNT